VKQSLQTGSRVQQSTFGNSFGRLSGPDLQAESGWEGYGRSGEPGKQVKQFGWIHEMACASENVLFVAELLNWRVQKLVLHPKK
jgi:hypothetical protein